MAKIAIDVDRAVARRKESGAEGGTDARVLAEGDGWAVADVMCTHGPDDRPFEEQHAHVSIAIVAAGSFQYRSESGRELMTPGSLLLGNPEQRFECSHEHRYGDRCVSFWYDPAFFERVAADAGCRSADLKFRALRLPPVRPLSSVVARACASLSSGVDVGWDEVAVELAARAIELAARRPARQDAAPPGAEARVTRAVRSIERHTADRITLAALAREADLSPYHFLRTFERLTGVTPHQFVRRARLREAAGRLATRGSKVLDIALDCGFGDVSNFNRAFRAEFGISPREYRLNAR